MLDTASTFVAYVVDDNTVSIFIFFDVVYKLLLELNQAIK